MKNYINTVLSEVWAVLSRIESSDTQRFISAIKSAKRIYITGVGRSGLVVKAFGQRLMHLGFEVHLADEISAPAISKGDILIACSGTGKTEFTLYMAKRAKVAGAKVAVLTASPKSALSKLARLVIIIPAPLESTKPGFGIKSRQPARSLFEQAMLLYLDAVIMELINTLHIKKRSIEKRHANLE